MNRPRSYQGWSEAAGVGLIALGLLLFLALLSFDTEDLPGWAFLIHQTSSPNEKTHNLVGVVGALFAGYSYFFFGAAAFWLAVLMLGLGAGMVFVRGFRLQSRIGWGALNVISAACLVQVIPWIAPNWSDWFVAHGPGGWIGHYLGEKALGTYLGPAGSVIVLLALYFSSLVLTTGFHPIQFCRRVLAGISALVVAWRQKRLQRLDEEQRIEEESRKLEKEAERLERKLRKQKKSQPPGEEESGPALPAALPEPKIIDSSFPVETRKPTLAEVRARHAGSKPDPAGGGLSEIQLDDYQMPDLDLLDTLEGDDRQPADPQELRDTQSIIIDTLAQFGIESAPGDITKGPTITRYELYPAKGVRVDRIVSLERDIARATKAERINILAPIPGKDTVGVELANAKKVKVTLRELFDTEAWTGSKAKLPLALGKDVYGNTIVADLAQMPHCLVAGTTGSGKSVCINAIIASLLYRYSPEDLRFIMIDPKVVEMQIYNSLPHLVTPVVTDPKKVLLALRWVIDEMELRYKIFAKVGVRNVATFNARPKPKTQAELDAEAGEDESPEETENNLSVEGDAPEEVPGEEEPPLVVPRDADQLIIPDKMPYIVVIVDELADLMQTAPADVEAGIARVTQMARAAGIHMIVATQTPRADVVTGIIKANIPSRIAFQVASKLDSRVILDENGAEKLLGQGDMLYLPPGTSKLTRAQGVLVTDEEIRRIVEHVSAQSQPVFDPTIHEKMTSTAQPEEDVSEEDELLVEKCLEIIKQERKASTSMLQRRLRLGYTRAARVVDILEQRGILGPKDGAKDREILVDLDSL
jgi:S-DNA-T family DNA segregation ATPase FtsK/SpoIIIE